MASDTFEVLLQGGSPWGFRLQGGKEFGAPLLIARVTDGSKAQKNGILVGDVLISINHESCETMTHTNALNYIKKSGNELHLTLDRRPFDSNDPYAYKSLPRGTKLTNGDVLKNNNYSNKTEYKSVESYATLPRKKQSKNSYVEQTDLDDHVDGERPDSLGTRSSSGVSSKYTEDDDELLPRAIGVISPSNDQWSPDLISDAVRPPQPIKLISEPDSKSIKYSTDARIKSPTTIRGFTDKPSPVGRGARRNFDEENTDSADNPELLTSGSSYTEDIPSDDDAAAEKPYRRYSYHGSVLKDDDDRKNNDTTERPRNQAGSGWYKELFKEMHTGAGNSTGLSSLLVGESSPPKHDSREMSKNHRERSVQEAKIQRTKSQETKADPSYMIGRSAHPEPTVEYNQPQRYSVSSFPASTADVKLRDKPTTRSNVPSWYREFQKGKEVSEKEITEDAKMPKNNKAMNTTRLPGDVGAEYPVVRGYSTTTRSSSNPAVHRGPPKKTHTYSNEQRASYQAPTVVQKEPDKPSASNLYEDHMKKRQFVPREQKKEIYEPVDYMKQFQEEEEKIKEDERRAKEDLERKLREEEEAEQRQREMEEKKRREMEEEERKRKETEARKNPKHARALYNFTPQTSKEIGFRKGDIVLFYRSIDSNWCEGEAQGQIGLYPLSYVEIIEESAPKIEGEGRVKYNFKAESARELHLQKGDIVALIRQIDENWFEGVKDDKVGIFPVSYIEVLRNPEEKPASPNVVKEEVVKKPNGYSKVESSVDGFPEPLNVEPDIRDLKGENFIVLFPYEPQNEDELELLEGDIVKVVEKCDDGWFVGISERTGDFGTFPGNYVKLV